MAKLDIITNHHWRELKDRCEVPPDILSCDFDYVEPGMEVGFFSYRGTWYHIDQFMRINKNNPLYVLGWHGIHGSSHFSGVLIKLSDDGEAYQVALYLS